MGVGIDHAGQNELALAIQQEIHPARPPVAAFQHFLDGAVIVDPQAGETPDLAIFLDGDALHVVDQSISHCGRGKSGSKAHGNTGEQCCVTRCHQFFPSGSRRINALVSCRPPLISCISA